ncbi:MAG: 50S ribosomal protein L25 [Candidatus Pacebacteria bacterium]|nr:50S ribosomal protein L25 [Candidatus Paceibacterota bacterium]
MAKVKLVVEKREIFGRKVKKLREQGILPANIYGKKVKSQAVQLEVRQFMPVYREVGETGIVDLSLAKEKNSRPVLIHNVQFDPVTDQAIHADFHQVNLSEKVKAEIPIELIGESPAAEQKSGILVRLLDELEVEALPTDLPEKIEVDTTVLAEVGDMIKVEDLSLDKDKIRVLTDSVRLIVKIEPPTKLEQEKKVAESESPAEGEEAVAEESASAETSQPAEEKNEASEEGKKEK